MQPYKLGFALLKTDDVKLPELGLILLVWNVEEVLSIKF